MKDGRLIRQHRVRPTAAASEVAAPPIKERNMTMMIVKTPRLAPLRAVLLWLSRSDRVGLAMMRAAIAIVFLWIGGVKFAAYEADSITPFVANSPMLSFFYRQPNQYKAHLTREGEFVSVQRDWQRENRTYAFSNALGTVELCIGMLVLAGFVSARIGAVGAMLSFATSLVTLSFLFTTPEAWVPALGDTEHGFPFLSGAGRLVLKDVMLLAGGFLLMVGSAKALLQDRVPYDGPSYPVDGKRIAEGLTPTLPIVAHDIGAGSP